jgi:hypothetical protein
MSKWTLTITNQLSAPNICWEFKPILLSSESWVYFTFYPWDLILSIPMLSPPWLLCSYARFRSLPCYFHMALALGRSHGKVKISWGDRVKIFKTMFHYLNIIFYVLKLMTMCTWFGSFSSIWCHFINSFYKFMLNIIVYFTIWKLSTI